MSLVVEEGRRREEGVCETFEVNGELSLGQKRQRREEGSVPTCIATHHAGECGLSEAEMFGGA